MRQKAWNLRKIKGFRLFLYIRGGIMLNRNVKKQINSVVNELNMNLENNYKDLAWDALGQLDRLVTELNSSGQIKEKDYKKLAAVVSDYKKRMEGYHH